MVKSFKSRKRRDYINWVVPVHLVVGALLGIVIAAAWAYPQPLPLYPQLPRAAIFGIIAASVTSLCHLFYLFLKQPKVGRRRTAL